MCAIFARPNGGGEGRVAGGAEDAESVLSLSLSLYLGYITVFGEREVGSSGSLSRARERLPVHGAGPVTSCLWQARNRNNARGISGGRGSASGGVSLEQRFAPSALHPATYILHPKPCAPHPTLYTLHPTPYSLHVETLHPESARAGLHGEGEIIGIADTGVNLKPETLDPKPSTQNPKPQTLNPRP